MRSSLGFFLFVPKGENERLLEATGFQQIIAEDVTDNIVITSGNWHAARAKRKHDLIRIEGEERFNGIQSFLETTHLLAEEKRLSRFLYHCRK